MHAEAAAWMSYYERRMALARETDPATVGAQFSGSEALTL
jgi:hypothetical protein